MTMGTTVVVVFWVTMAVMGAWNMYLLRDIIIHRKRREGKSRRQKRKERKANKKALIASQ